jgi:hypothetical protein
VITDLCKFKSLNCDYTGYLKRALTNLKAIYIY